MVSVIRRSGALVCGALLALSLGAASAADAPLDAIRVATVPVDAGAEVYYAQKMGFFKANGLNVEITGLSNGAAVTAAVIGGAADIGQSNAVSVAQAHERGIPVVIIAGANRYTIPAQESGLAVPVDSPIHSAKDLTGKTIAISGIGGITEIGSRNWLDKSGGDSKSVAGPPQARRSVCEDHVPNGKVGEHASCGIRSDPPRRSQGAVHQYRSPHSLR
jgi:NitT/TauT family transport system substrate-binding protein